jgi:hypothetical protein
MIMSNDEALRRGELADYEFGEQVAPDGFNPDAQGYEPPPPGEFVVRIGESPSDEDAYRIKPNHEFRDRRIPGGSWIGTQIQPSIVIAEGEHKGKSVYDYLPCPTPGKQMPKPLADRWANFIRAFGFRPPENRLIPPGFKLEHLCGEKTLAIAKFEAHSYEKVDDEGEPKKIETVRIKYMGYSPCNGAQAGAGGVRRKATAETPAATQPEAAKPAASADDILGDL